MGLSLKNMGYKPFSLITGASSGIGKAIATELAKRNVNLLLVALPDPDLEETAINLRNDYGVVIHTLPLDLTQSDASEIVLNWCQQNNFKVNILVNNAGFGNFCSFQKMSYDVMSSMVLLNNHALISLTHRFLPELRKHPQAYIMNLGSLASFIHVPNKSIYSATKSFVYAFSSSLRLELKPFNIHVSCLCPGPTLTSNRVLSNFKEANYQGNLFTQEACEVAKIAVRQMFNKKFKIITGWPNRFLYLLSVLLPNRVINVVLIRLFNKRETAPLPSSPGLSPLAMINR